MPSMVRTHVTFFSADLADQFGIENLYGVVREGGWTYDYMMKTSEAVFSAICEKIIAVWPLYANQPRREGDSALRGRVET